MLGAACRRHNKQRQGCGSATHFSQQYSGRAAAVGQQNHPQKCWLSTAAFTKPASLQLAAVMKRDNTTTHHQAATLQNDRPACLNTGCIAPVTQRREAEPMPLHTSSAVLRDGIQLTCVLCWASRHCAISSSNQANAPAIASISWADIGHLVCGL